MDVADYLVRLVRAALKLDPDEKKPPRIDHLAFYRAEVKAAASDGSTVDVAPEDTRIKGHQKVKLLVATPGNTSVAKAGAIVHLGWERGDPSRPIAVPLWESGKKAAKIVFDGDDIWIGDGNDSNLVKVARADAVDKNFKTVKDAINNFQIDLATDGGTSSNTSNAVVGSPCTLVSGTLKPVTPPCGDLDDTGSSNVKVKK